MMKSKQSKREKRDVHSDAIRKRPLIILEIGEKYLLLYSSQSSHVPVRFAIIHSFKTQVVIIFYLLHSSYITNDITHRCRLLLPNCKVSLDNLVPYSKPRTWCESLQWKRKHRLKIDPIKTITGLSESEEKKHHFGL